MIRFSFSLRRRGNRRLAKGAISRCLLRASDRGNAPNPHCTSRGPGWFDSSWDLIHGLDVREGPPDSAFA